MKPLINLVTFLTICLLPITNFAQISQGISDRIDGYTFNNSIKVSSNEYVVATGKYNERSNLNLVKYNSNLQILWNKKLPDGVISISVLSGKLLILSSPEWDKNDYSNIKSIKATVIDPQNGNSTLDKTITTIDDKFFTEPRTLLDSSNNFKGLLLRTSNMQKVKMFNQGKSFEERRHTQKMTWLTFNESMDLKTTNNINYNFGNSEIVFEFGASSGNLFVGLLDNDKINVSEFSADGSAKATLSCKLPGLPDDGFMGSRNILSHEETSVISTFNYKSSSKEDITVSIKFDFAQNATSSDIMKPETKIGNLKSRYDFPRFDQVGLGYYKNNLFSIQEFNASETRSSYSNFNGSTSTSSSTIYYNQSLLVSFFDDKMQTLKQISIDKNFPTFIDVGKEPGFKVIGNKLIIFADIFAGSKIAISAKFDMRYIVIDLDKQEIVKDGIVNVDKQFEHGIVDCSSTVWSGNDAIIFHLRDDNPLSTKNFSFTLEKIHFDF